jgi:ribosomal protein L19E
MSAKAVGLSKMIINKETLSGIMGGMSATDWKQLVKKRHVWTQEEVSSAFKKFVDH